MKPLRSVLAAALALALGIGLGVGVTAPAVAAPPPVTFSLAAVDLVTGAPVTQVTSGTGFTYTASIGCPDPDGCGPATLDIVIPEHVTFIAGGFYAPAGATYAFTPLVPGGTGPGGTLTLNWDELAGTAVAFVPVEVLADVDVSNNGTQQTATAELRAGTPEEPVSRPGTATVTLRVYGVPGITGETIGWANSSVVDGTSATTSTTFTGVAAGNAASSLTFVVPNAASVPATSLRAADAFDLSSLTLSSNPGGAQITLLHADGSTTQHSLPAGTTSLTTPATTVGYTVVVSGLPSVAADNLAARTVSVVANYTLRTTARDGGRIIEASATQRDVRVTGTVTNTVADAATEAGSTVSRQVSAAISVTAVAPSVDHSITWVTGSGDQTSVYESQETSTLTVALSNSGVPGLTSLSMTLPHLGAQYFEYQELTAPPAVTFPAGSSSATIQYTYVTGSPATSYVGAPHMFTPGSIVPGPELDDPDGDHPERTLDRVSGVVVVFQTAQGASMPGGCALTDPCAGSVVLSSKLRDNQLTSGAAI